jgi:hypothetical protein
MRPGVPKETVEGERGVAPVPKVVNTLKGSTDVQGAAGRW